MAEVRDREQSDRPPSEAAKGEKAKADEPLRPPSTDKDDAEPETIETDLLIEDRFEATDN